MTASDSENKTLAFFRSSQGSIEGQKKEEKD